MVKKKRLVWPNCFESDLAKKIRLWLSETNLTNSIVFLEGEMGSGKSTFVREVLRVLAPECITQGSPTFPLVQLYPLKNGNTFYHIDLYRLRNEDELADSGIESQMEEPIAIACVEWASLFPAAFAHWFDETKPRRKQVWLVKIVNDETNVRASAGEHPAAASENHDATRTYEIQEY
jgi:tRNA threonylcarbamoyl adenosine modification protein YjeE